MLDYAIKSSSFFSSPPLSPQTSPYFLRSPLQPLSYKYTTLLPVLYTTTRDATLTPRILTIQHVRPFSHFLNPRPVLCDAVAPFFRLSLHCLSFFFVYFKTRALTDSSLNKKLFKRLFFICTLVFCYSLFSYLSSSFRFPLLRTFILLKF